MTLARRLNLLLVALALALVLGATCPAQAGFGDMFKKKNADKVPTTRAPAAPANRAGAGARSATDEDDSDPETGPGDVGAAAAAAASQGASGELRAGGRTRLRLNLDKVRQARDEQDRLAAGAAPKYPKRPTYKAASEGPSKVVQGRGRHSPATAAADSADLPDDDDDDDDGYEEAMAAYRKQVGGKGAGPGEEIDPDADEGSGFLARIKNKKLREQLAAKFVSTHKSEKAGEEIKPKLSVRRARRPLKGAQAAAEDSAARKKSGSYWGKQFGKALKGAKKGLKASATAIAELPAYMATVADSVNAFLQLDGKGKLLSMIDQVKGDIHFVRKEFSQFTLNWSPIMEKALNYLGDSDLDKIKWNDRDELDLRKDALHSLTIGYEFMRLMVAWRENLLMGHEAYKLWLESVKSEYEQKHFEMDEDMVMQLTTIQNYLLLTSWERIDEQTAETRAKLDHLMEIEDDRPKNYESEYFRNIIVLQEMYFPTVEEFDAEKEQVQRSISVSGVVVENLEQVDEFIESFRKQVVSREANGVDCKVPIELENFLDKLGPQLDHSKLVYTKGFIKELKELREREEMEMNQRLQQEQEQKQHEQQQPEGDEEGKEKSEKSSKKNNGKKKSSWFR